MGGPPGRPLNLDVRDPDAAQVVQALQRFLARKTLGPEVGFDVMRILPQGVVPPGPVLAKGFVRGVTTPGVTNMQEAACVKSGC